MSIIYFLIILSVLVLVHEAGHFFIARLFGIRVDEFGLGYPPRAKKLFRWKGTDFTLNWLPFGGFVKIFGENSLDEEGNETAFEPDSFASKPRPVQALVLISGVAANVLFAWFLFSFGFMIGMPASVNGNLPVTNPHTIITEIIKGSPADLSGVKAGDEIESITRNNQTADVSPEDASAFISAAQTPIVMTLKRGSDTFTKALTPASGVVEGKPAIGVALDEIGTTKLGFGRSIVEGARTTWGLVEAVVVGLWVFLKNIFIGHADFSQVSGPVGIVGMVGDAKALGFIYLLSFTALISANLAVLNLLPIPALDGGRLLFVIIESVIRRPISPRVINTVNTVGFVLLIILMILVTFRDVARLI